MTRWLRSIRPLAEHQIEASLGADRQWWIGVTAAVREAEGTFSVDHAKLAGVTQSGCSRAVQRIADATTSRRTRALSFEELFGATVDDKASWKMAAPPVSIAWPALVPPAVLAPRAVAPAANRPAPVPPAVLAPTAVAPAANWPAPAQHYGDAALERAAEAIVDGEFRGDDGIRRLRHIVKVLRTTDEFPEELLEAKLELARLLEAGRPPRIVAAAYADAFQSAVALDAYYANANDEDSFVAQVGGSWLEWLARTGDLAGVRALLAERLKGRPWLDGHTFDSLVRQRLADSNQGTGEREAKALAELLADCGAPAAAADITATIARWLFESARSDEAIAACIAAHESGWVSRDLANRWSMILERLHRNDETVAVCQRWLVAHPDDEQFSKRLKRCKERAGRGTPPTERDG